MPQTKSFIEVLEDEIRADLRRELESELAQRKTAEHFKASHAAGQFELWMASHVGPVTFKTKKTYPAGASKKQPKAASLDDETKAFQKPLSSSEPRFQAQTTAEHIAVELLSRSAGQTLGALFTEAELKSVWRKAAMKTHPDRFSQADLLEQTRATAHFRELASAYEILLDLTAVSKAA